MELFNQLRKNPKYWIRFELGLIELKGEKYFKEIYNRVLSIFDFLFHKNDTIQLIASIHTPIKYRGNELVNIQRFLKNKKLIYGLNCKTVLYEYDEEDTEMKTTQYSLKLKKEDIRLGYLFQAISNTDFGSRKPRIEGSIYLLNLTNSTLLHMYDDRGCDVYSLDKENLLPLYRKYRNWILDYNRIKIDHIFEEGLFNYSETSIEMENRLQINRSRVKETGINLYEDNTCEITHQLEIPKKTIEECVKEIEQTGFIIEVDHRYNDYSILEAIKTEALALIDYQTELMFLYAKKYNGKYKGWSVQRAF